MCNNAFGDRPAPGRITSVTHLCKHCDALGNECEACGGDGCASETAAELMIDPVHGMAPAPCSTCNGEGVVLVAETQSRQDAIAEYIGTMIDDMLDEAHYWKMPPGETEPTWLELRQALTEKLFSVEHEMGRAELHSEQVQDNCL